MSQCYMKRNLSAYSHIIFYYNLGEFYPNSQKIKCIFNKGLRKVPNNQLPLFLSATSRQLFFFIGSQNRFHLRSIHLGSNYTPIIPTGSELAWYSKGRTFAAHLAQQVLWFAASIALCNTSSSRGTALCKVGRATSKFDLPSLTPLSLVCCSRVQLGAPHWAVLVNTASSW